MKSVQQALRVLRHVYEHPQSTMSDIARANELSTSTAHRILATLEVAGFVSRDDDRGFTGVPVGQQRTIDDSIAHCVEVAQPHLRALGSVTAETVHIATLRGSLVEFVAAVESTKLVRVSSRVGLQVPAGAAAAGKMLLASLPQHEFDALEPTVAEALGSAAHPLQASLQSVIAQTRSLGFARNINETEDGIYALAVPIRRPVGPVLCSLTITAPTTRMPPLSHSKMTPVERSWLEELRRSARSIERALLH
ncbi:IclR family transcriptional regulator [Klugiella sp. YN-L-19]|uniref:IclR family transcriptional regulator n=1 Tax=Ruicaihuangia caeni TaxID=3042517 RepID=A0AAW6TCR6_9MICO|nr:IclR family transcriptional regulator [Klugiella sp. YN-L-19]MDI2099618.1 IclR family transcriptional regulator [Klugiella sp. YN-L-19]